MQDLLAYRDGNFIKKSQLTIAFDDLGFERGFGVFDYCRMRNGKITFLRDHLERLDHSQSLLNFSDPVSMEKVAEVINELQNQNKLSNSYFKILITGKVESSGIRPVLTIYQDFYTQYSPELYENGIALIIQDFEKPFPAFKTTFYLGTFREYNRMIQSGAEDVLLYANNIVRECSRCNIFIVKGETVYTPSQNMLKGVTRKHVMESAKEIVFVVETDISIEDLFNADEVFITSTTKNIMPVTRIEDRMIADGSPGMVTNKLMELFDQYCRKYEAY